MALTVPQTTGNTYNYQTIEVVVGGNRYIDISAISYDDALEPGKTRGTHPQSTGRTPGQYEAEASMTLSKGTAEAIRQDLGDGYLQKHFDVVVNYNPGGGLDLITDELKGCRVKRMSDSHSEGPDGLMEEWELSVWSIKRNGKDPLETMLG